MNHSLSVLGSALPLAILLVPASALAQTGPVPSPPPTVTAEPQTDPAATPQQPTVADPSSAPQTTSDVPGTLPEGAAKEDPTGGAYTNPTLLFIPAASVPRWNVRVIASTELQSPAASDAAFRPGLGAEIGLPAGFTVGAGTNWVGGDTNPNTSKTDFNLGLSPYFQGRLHLVGAADGMGWQLGTSVTYKFVGFEGDPGEAELALSLQYRHLKYEAGLQGAMGQDFGDSRHHDGEVHAYALYRVIPQLGLGAAGQVRIAIAPPEDFAGNKYDALGGAIASLTLGRYQIGALGGASTLGLDPGKVGGLGQLFGTARF